MHWRAFLSACAGVFLAELAFAAIDAVRLLLAERADAAAGRMAADRINSDLRALTPPDSEDPFGRAAEDVRQVRFQRQQWGVHPRLGRQE